MPPSINRAYINVPNRGRVASRELTDYKHVFKIWALRNSKLLQKIRPRLQNKRISLQLDFHLPKERLYTKKGEPKRLDVSNRIKVIEDLIAKALALDDKWIFYISAVKKIGKHEHVTITLKCFEDDDGSNCP